MPQNFLSRNPPPQVLKRPRGASTTPQYPKTTGWHFTFVSELWTGSTSHCKITQESEFVYSVFDLQEKGDHVMADRGFNIRDLLTKKTVHLNIPPLSKGIKTLIIFPDIESYQPVFRNNITIMVENCLAMKNSYENLMSA